MYIFDKRKREGNAIRVGINRELEAEAISILELLKAIKNLRMAKSIKLLSELLF